MPFQHYILSLFLLLFTFTAFGQNKDFKKSKKFKSKQVSTATLLEEATSLREKAPQEAIKLLDKVIQKSRKEDRNSAGKAYFLLGNIYEDIDQEDLALQRYEMALKIYRSKKRSSAKLHKFISVLVKFI